MNTSQSVINLLVHGGGTSGPDPLSDIPKQHQPCDSPANHNALQRQHLQNARSGHYSARPVGVSLHVMHDWLDDPCAVRIASAQRSP